MEVTMKKKILLVEDHQETINVMKKELEVLGYEVAVAKNGVDAVEMARALRPDLIVMDIAMPKVDGLEATARIRKQPETQATPILAATARIIEADREKCLASGCNEYITKPFTYTELDEVIRKLLNEHGV
jgi:two-component system, cell cycle response regulator DivK